jgi:phosphoglycerate dehydrogenase-like enzyme
MDDASRLRATLDRLVIVNQISERVGERLRRHPLNPVVIDDIDPKRPWEFPPEANVLVTRALKGWSQAPNGPERPFDHLLWVQTMSAGIDFYPRWLLSDRLVSTGRGLTAKVIADYVMTAILNIEKPIHRLGASSRKDWFQTTLGRLEGKRLGLFGYGAIGQEIARRARAFDMDVLVCRRSPPTQEIDGIRFCTSIDELAEGSDHLVLAAPATPETTGIISADVLARAKPGLHLINISRGDLIDQEALVTALSSNGPVAFATLDVTTPEPLPDGHPLYDMPNVHLTPHIAWSGADAEGGVAERICRSLDVVAAGGLPEALVNPARGY